MDSDYFSQTPNTSLETSNVAASGCILKIHMKNFMCHDNLEVDLNPRINFIIGKNGSGKSAIQTALAVGLGGKTTATNRGTSLKALIKNDKNTSNITIVICNEGPLAYKPKEYGPTIKVERQFSHSTSSYKIKNSCDKIVSTEKSELDKIVTHFNLQPENPLCILHQDTARNFLNSSDPKIKFKFYLKASRFGDINQLYDDTNFKILATNTINNNKFEAAKEAFHDVLEMKKKVKTLEEAKAKQKQCEELKNELVWAEINNKKLELQGLQKKKGIEIMEIQNLKRQKKTLEDNDTGEKIRSLESKIFEMDESVKEAKTNLKQKKDEFNSNKEKLSSFLIEYKEEKRNCTINKVKYDSCMKEIETLTNNAPGLKLSQERTKYELSNLEKELESFKAAMKTIEQDKQMLSNTEEMEKKNLDDMNEKLNALITQKSKKENKVKQITSNSSSLSVYGEVIVKIVDEINRSVTKFKKTPIGPIGMHIKVKDPKWAGAVENFLGKGFLSSFCVDNSRDSAVLAAIFKKICSQYNATQPAIICSKFLTTIHNIGPHETGTRKYKNLARKLEINNPVVANCLVDQQEIETVLLIPTNEEAYNMLDEEHKVPRNCKRAFTLTGDQFYPAPNYRSYSASKIVSHATLLQAKQEDLISLLKNEINKLSQEIINIERERKNAEEQCNITSSSLNMNKTELKNLKRKIIMNEQRIKELKNILEESTETNVGFFIEESKVLESNVKISSENLQKLEKEYKKLKEEYSKSENEYKELQHFIAEADRKKAPVHGEIQHLKSNLQQTSSKSDIIKQRLNEHEKKLNKYDLEIAQLTEEITKCTQSASQLCDPISTQRSTEEIEKELKSLEHYLHRLEEENGGNLICLQKTLKERYDAFEAVSKDLNSMRKLISKAQDSLEKRRRKKSRMESVMITSTKMNFQFCLNERNFDGKLEFNLKEETLEIKVYPIHGNQSGSTENVPNIKCLGTSSLSGGEKSFSTVSFIMSLWRQTDLPTHFMDEFDVFMDGVNRKIIIDLLLDHAKNHKKQFVFLSPLDTSVPVSNIITIHRLESPRQ